MDSPDLNLPINEWYELRDFQSQRCRREIRLKMFINLYITN